MRILMLSMSLLLCLSSSALAADGFATYYTVASCQREGTSGVYTASGERYDESAMTCALPKQVGERKWGREFMVYGHNTGKSVVVRYNDQGPGNGPQSKGVVIDLTPAAFKEVCGDLKQGKCKISYMEVL